MILLRDKKEQKGLHCLTVLLYGPIMIKFKNVEFKSDIVSGCCQQKVIFEDICADCGQHCDLTLEDEAEDEIFQALIFQALIKGSSNESSNKHEKN